MKQPRTYKAYFSDYIMVEVKVPIEDKDTWMHIEDMWKAQHGIILRGQFGKVIDKINGIVYLFIKLPRHYNAQVIQDTLVKETQRVVGTKIERDNIEPITIKKKPKEKPKPIDVIDNKTKKGN
jgi:hypothetical protein